MASHVGLDIAWKNKDNNAESIDQSHLFNYPVVLTIFWYVLRNMTKIFIYLIKEQGKKRLLRGARPGLKKSKEVNKDKTKQKPKNKSP